MNRKQKVARSFCWRNRVLRSLGFEKYQDYLDSSLWATIRDRVLTTKGRQCFCCNAEATSVHHNKYDRATLLGEKLKQLVPICSQCHVLIEFDDAGKTPTNVAKLKFKQLRNKHLKKGNKERMSK